jgi:hypothetical protein
MFTGWKAWGLIPGRARDLFLLQNVNTGCGASYSMDTGSLALGLKRPGRESDRHLVPRLIISVDIPLLLLYAFITWKGAILLYFFYSSSSFPSLFSFTSFIEVN